jgi:prevent-host-death family protein
MARDSARADARRGTQVYRQRQPGRTKIVSATEAKNRLGALLAELANGTSTIVIEHHGHPRAVMISADEWAALSAARERMLRQDAWEQLWTLAAEASVLNADLTPEDADAIADLIGDEAKRRVARRAAMS